MTIENEANEILEQGDIAQPEATQDVVEDVSQDDGEVQAKLSQDETGDENAAQESVKEEPKPEKHKLTFNERQEQIKEQTRQKWEAQRAMEAEKLALQKERAELEQLRKQYGVPEPDAPPNPAQYSEDQADKYVDDLANWKANKIASEKVNAQLRQAEQLNAQKQAEQSQAEYNKKWSERVAKDPSFKERELDVYRYIQANGLKELGMDIMEDENNVDLIDYLGKNLGELEDLAQLPPKRAAKELGKITARLSTPQSRTVSKANAPINPVRQTGNNGVRNPEDMDHASYSEYMNKKQFGY